MPRTLILLALLALTATVHAAEDTTYNRVDFNTEATRRVANDLLQAQLSVEVNDRSPARVAQLLNTAINEALKKAAAFPAVQGASTSYTTYPVYGKNNRLEGWRGNAGIHLESRDFKAAGELIGELQGSLQLAGVNFSIAPATRRQTEDELVNEGLAAFRKRAEAIRTALGGSGYRIVQVNISHGGFQPQPLQMGRAMLAMAEAAPPPEFAGGDSDLTLQVSGTIEVIFHPATN